MTRIALVETNRGFRRGDFEDANGEACSIQESSAAEAAFIWLGVVLLMAAGACFLRAALAHKFQPDPQEGPR
jgi:hypothetical protein